MYSFDYIYFTQRAKGFWYWEYFLYFSRIFFRTFTSLYPDSYVEIKEILKQFWSAYSFSSFSFEHTISHFWNVLDGLRILCFTHHRKRCSSSISLINYPIIFENCVIIYSKKIQNLLPSWNPLFPYTIIFIAFKHSQRL